VVQSETITHEPASLIRGAVTDPDRNYHSLNRFIFLVNSLYTVSKC